MSIGQAQSPEPTSEVSVPRQARIVLVAFVITFLLARILVLLIMSRRIPDLYLHVGQTHVHHLNYGIFLLVGVGGYLLMRRPGARGMRCAAAAYGVGLGLTFDEFGMWLHLGGGYWQRASYDAVVIIASILSLLALAPKLRQMRLHHLLLGITIVLLVGVFLSLQKQRLREIGQTLQHQLQELEQSGPR
ncbi:MAG: hypothetical protein NZ561_03985 [Phycisphaerae bacterium]|nr:hypothetical protein [Phycisphaerae bacterium]MDW8262717.1 hypothetical protein [Phycisphaerales bacterium]